MPGESWETEAAPLQVVFGCHGRLSAQLRHSAAAVEEADAAEGCGPKGAGGTSAAEYCRMVAVSRLLGKHVVIARGFDAFSRAAVRRAGRNTRPKRPAEAFVKSIRQKHPSDVSILCR